MFEPFACTLFNAVLLDLLDPKTSDDFRLVKFSYVNYGYPPDTRVTLDTRLSAPSIGLIIAYLS